MSSPPRTPGGAPIRPEIQWRYLEWKSPDRRRRSTVVHALRHNIFAPGLSRVAACGAMTKLGGNWHGGGNPTERDIANRLRPCKSCLKNFGLTQ